MFELSRRVRFGVDLHVDADDSAAPGKHNTFAGWPPLTGLGVFCEFEVRCRGEADSTTGYMMNISAIDAAVREHVLPIVSQAVQNRPAPPAERVLSDALAALQPALDHAVASVRWWVTPYYCLTMNAQTPDAVTISQQFEFAAAHRLHCASLSDAENDRIFGKCNNINGHGHNYRLEPVVAVPLDGSGGEPAMRLPDLERIVDQTVIQRFDHANLNQDLPEFRQINPSVEHIAKVCYDLLRDPITDAGGRLMRVTVWETEKTSCTYPSEPAGR